MPLNALIARFSVSLWIAACTSGQSGAPVAGMGGTSGEGGGMSVEVPCSANACEERIRDRLERDLGARVTPRPRFSTGECVHVATELGVSGEACSCASDDSGFETLGPRQPGCLVYGHGGTCLWQGTDMPEECSSASCQAACEELSDRFAADDQIAYSFVLRYAACADGACQGVVEIDGRCYSTEGLQWSHIQDCSSSDSEIIMNAEEMSVEGTTTTCDDVTECSGAYGCRDGVCLWCNDSVQCADDEQCVNSLCVLTAAVECQSDEDCSVEGELCLLFGAETVDGAPGRGNANLTAECAHPDEL